MSPDTGTISNKTAETAAPIHYKIKYLQKTDIPAESPTASFIRLKTIFVVAIISSSVTVNTSSGPYIPLNNGKGLNANLIHSERPAFVSRLVSQPPLKFLVFVLKHVANL